MFRIGYIDEDEGWQNSFYQKLKEDFDVKLFEITKETSKESLVEEIFESALDVLVLDFRLDENDLLDFNADEIIEKIQQINLHYPLIVLTSYEEDALDNVENANLVNDKEMLQSKNNILKRKLSSIASGYKEKIESAKKNLQRLEKRRAAAGLNSSEEDQYVELNTFLDQTICAENRLSRTFYSEETNKKLDDLINLAERVLDNVKDK